MGFQVSCGIGVWNDVFQILLLFSIATNTGIALFTSKFGERFSDDYRWMAFVAVQNALLVLHYVIQARALRQTNGERRTRKELYEQEILWRRRKATQLQPPPCIPGSKLRRMNNASFIRSSLRGLETSELMDSVETLDDIALSINKDIEELRTSFGAADAGEVQLEPFGSLSGAESEGNPSGPSWGRRNVPVG